MLVAIISEPSFITSQIPQALLNYGPWTSPKLGFPLSKSKSFYSVFIKFCEYVGGHYIWTKFYNLQNPPGTTELWPLNCPKTELAVSALPVEYPAPKNVVIRFEFTTNTKGVFCVSLALLFSDKNLWLKMLGLYLYTRIIGHKSCNMFSILNKLTFQ